MKRILTASSMAAALLCSCAGCAMWSKDKSSKSTDSSWSMSKMFKQEYQTPQKLAVIWSPDVMVEPGKPAMRGFGGRVYFYNERSQAIPVEGELVVHGFSEVSLASNSEAADKSFRFTSDQLTDRFSPSEFGASYSVWVPWDADGGFREQLTLITTFKTAAGAVVQGAPAKVNLPGKNRLAAKDQKRQSPYSTVSYRKKSVATNPGVELPNLAGGTAGRKRRGATTIEVPKSSSLAQPKRKTFTLGAPGRASKQPNAIAGQAAAANVTPANAIPANVAPSNAAPSMPVNQPAAFRSPFSAAAAPATATPVTATPATAAPAVGVPAAGVPAASAPQLNNMQAVPANSGAPSKIATDYQRQAQAALLARQAVMQKTAQSMPAAQDALPPGVELSPTPSFGKWASPTRPAARQDSLTPRQRPDQPLTGQNDFSLKPWYGR